MDDFISTFGEMVYQYYVATSLNTPPETLDRLANDEAKWVRCAVARNPNTPKYIKEYLNAIEFMGNCYGS